MHVTCTEEEIPRAKALMEYIEEFLKGVEVGRTYEQCKVCPWKHLYERDVHSACTSYVSYQGYPVICVCHWQATVTPQRA